MEFKNSNFSPNAYSSPYKGSGNLTREQFYFYEMRTTARLMCSGLSDLQIAERIKSDNLFQYPTERTINQAISSCIRRLHALDDDQLVNAIAEMDSNTAKQICLYAMMRHYRLVWDFMITVIGEKFRNQELSFTRQDVNIFFLRLQEQDDTVAEWSENTVKKIGSVLTRVLIETEYIDSAKANRLNPVLICSTLESAIRDSGDVRALSAFNCIE